MAAFDAMAEVTPKKDIPVPLYPSEDMPSFIRDNNVPLAILCVPAEHAQQVVNVLVESGIQGILNFSPVVLQVPSNVTVNNVDLALELENLNYFVRK